MSCVPDSNCSAGCFCSLSHHLSVLSLGADVQDPKVDMTMSVLVPEKKEKKKEKEKKGGKKKKL